MKALQLRFQLTELSNKEVNDNVFQTNVKSSVLALRRYLVKPRSRSAVARPRLACWQSFCVIAFRGIKTKIRRRRRGVFYGVFDVNIDVKRDVPRSTKINT